MTRLFAAVLGIVLAGCGVAPPPTPVPDPSSSPTRTPTPTSTPTPSGSALPTPRPSPTAAPTPTPAPDPRDLGNTGDLELLVVHVVDDAPFFDVVVEAVTPTGARRTVGTIPDVHPAGWEEARPAPGGRISVSEDGYVVIETERAGGDTADSTMRLVHDLTRPAAAPVELPADGGAPMWGPDGRLAWVVDAQAGDPLGAGQRLIVATPTGGLVSGDAVPEDILATAIWAAGGGGWLASRTIDLAAGVLREDLVFEAGPAAVYERTGVERLHSVRGGSLASGISDGPDGAEYEVQEYGLDTGGACRCVAWLAWTSGAKPRSTVWDAAADGLWILSSSPDDARYWLEHRTQPGVAGRPLDLPPADWAIVGRASDDSVLVLEASEERQVAVVDTRAWGMRFLAEAQAGGAVGPTFGGWLGG